MNQQATADSSFAPLTDSIDDALDEIFGFESFRRGQRVAIESVCEGRDTVVVMPTGSGKSLCYMLPACTIEGLTLVVSPLIALMKDQTDALEEFGVSATFINSSLTRREQNRRLGEICNGVYELVFVAPERFKSDVFTRAVEQLPIGLFAIDEAHCISQWGHDFRPDYLSLDEVRRRLGQPTTLALTATATPQVQSDIAEQLELDEPEVVVSGFERPNLFFEVYRARGGREKHERLEAALQRIEAGSAIVYCATRKQVRKVAARLRDNGHHPAEYHAGLAGEKRDEIQDAFMAGDAPLLIATNAFGMGVDKSDVRAIVHYNIPGSVEAYYQEAGRAGRDGEPSHCLLLYGHSDRGIHEFFIENSYPERSVVERVWEHLRRQGTGAHRIEPETIADQVGRGGGDRVHSWAVESSLRLLERGGHVSFGRRDGQFVIDVVDRARKRELRVDWQALDARRSIEEEQLEDAVRYATTNGCRQDFLSRYFRSGDSDADGCDHCDVCCGPPDYAATKSRDRITVTDSPETLVRKLLSGVARSERRRGGWGTHAVAGMLRGSTAKKIRRAGLDDLSTYGLLSRCRQRDLVRLLDVLLRLGLTRQDTHGCLHLTDRGTKVMTSSDPLPPDVEQTIGRHVDCVDGLDRGNSGGEALDIQSRDLSDTYLRTLKRRREGLNHDQIAEDRGLTVNSVLRHYIALADAGYELDIDDEADDALLDELRDVAADFAPGDPLKELKESLSTPCSYTTLKLNLAILVGERPDDVSE